MALKQSNMLPLGTIAPDFTLLDVIAGQHVNLQRSKSTIATVIMFICNHCPYVQHIKTTLARVAHDYQAKGIKFIAINSNDIASYPQDAPPLMKEMASESHFSFPYLFDETQEIAHAYQAACTPDFFIFDKHLKCVYRGQFDDSRPGNNIPITGKDLTRALDCLLANKTVPHEQKPSIGCNIKYR
jgi:thiol-disulfide isomerase/thioredoxin